MSAEFRRRHMQKIESNEDDVASQIRINHSGELEVIDAALDQILQGLDAFAYEKQRPRTQLEDAQVFLVIRSFNSLRVARQVLERGYYQQACALARMAMEDQLVVGDAESHPQTLDALLDAKGSFRPRALRFGRMAKRIAPEYSEGVWNKYYNYLSERAAHPRHKSLMTLPTAHGTLRPGGHYREVFVRESLFFLLHQLMEVFFTINRLTANVGIPWYKDATLSLHDMLALYREIAERLELLVGGDED